MILGAGTISTQPNRRSQQLSVDSPPPQKEDLHRKLDERNIKFGPKKHATFWSYIKGVTLKQNFAHEFCGHPFVQISGVHFWRTEAWIICDFVKRV